RACALPPPRKSPKSKKMESGGVGNFPIQKDGIFSRRELPGRVGNFPIQKDGIFFVRELPNSKGWILLAPGSSRRGGRAWRASGRRLLPGVVSLAPWDEPPARRLR